MTMNRLLAAAAALLLSTGVARATAPAVFTYTGFLQDGSGAALTGTHDFAFEFWTAPSGGSSLGSKTVTAVPVASDGYFSVVIDVSAFSAAFGAQTYMALKVDTDPYMATRIQLTSAPGALSVPFGGVTGWPTTPCTSGQFATGYDVNGNLICAAPAGSGTVTNVTATAPLSVVTGTTTPVIAIAACTANQILKWNGTSWACAADADTTYAAGTGLALAGTTFSLSTSGCAAGSVWKYNGTTWTCQLDSNSGGTVTSVAAGAGLTGGTITTTGTIAPNFTTAGGDNGAGTTVARGDHLHDGRYYTQAALSSAGTINAATNPVDWTQLKNVPPGSYAGTRSYAASSYGWYDPLPATLGSDAYTFPISWTATFNGYCRWTAVQRIFFGTVTVQNAMSCAYKIGASAPTNYGAYQAMFGPVLPGWGFSDASFTYAIPVTAGATYQFGCYHQTTSNSVGNASNCFTTVHCTPN
jgi:hypothetical protein